MMKQLEKIIKDDKKLKIIVLCGLVLIAVMFLWGLFPEGEKKNSAQPNAVESISVEEYAASLEKKVGDMVSRIAGAGQAEVMLTLETGKETVYQNDTKREVSNQSDTGDRQENSQETVVLIDGENGKKQALVQTEKTPVVQGVVVICDGAEDARVQQRITEAVTTAFHIPSTKVAIVLRTSQKE